VKPVLFLKASHIAGGSMVKQALYVAGMTQHDPLETK
jgi:hypothetical protein